MISGTLTRLGVNGIISDIESEVCNDHYDMIMMLVIMPLNPIKCVLLIINK